MINKKLIKKNERIFIAGSRGMAGSAILRKLKDAGYGRKEQSGEFLIPNRDELDLLDSQQVKKWFEEKKPTVVILAAAKVGGILANSSQPADFLLNNIKIQTNVIENAFRNNVKRLLFLGSSCIYPKFSEQPIKEEYLMSGALEKTNEWYAIAKISGIKLCDSLRKQYGFDAISLMPTNLYGPGDNYHPSDSHVMAALIRKFSEASLNSSKSVTCWGTGEPLREFMHVDDLGEAVIFALENWNPSNDLAPINKDGNPLTFLNVGTGIDLSIKELSEKIAQITNFNGEIIWDKNKPDGTPKKQLDITKMKSLGWESKIDLDKGIRSTVEIFKSNLLKNR